MCVCDSLDDLRCKIDDMEDRLTGYEELFKILLRGRLIRIWSGRDADCRSHHKVEGTLSDYDDGRIFVDTVHGRLIAHLSDVMEVIG